MGSLDTSRETLTGIVAAVRPHSPWEWAKGVLKGFIWAKSV